MLDCAILHSIFHVSIPPFFFSPQSSMALALLLVSRSSLRPGEKTSVRMQAPSHWLHGLLRTICMKTPRHSRDAFRCHCTTFLLVSNMQLGFCRVARKSGTPNPSTMQEPNSPNKRARRTPKTRNKMQSRLWHN